MKKTMTYLSMAALALVGVMMTGCSNEDEALIDNQETKLVTLTTTISLDGGAQTRALDAAGHKTFAENDQITFVYKNTGGQTNVAFSQLAASDISADGKKATISVTMESPVDNSQLRLIYPSLMAQYGIQIDATIDDEHTIDYSYLQNSQNGFIGMLGSNFDLAVFDGSLNGNALPASITLTNKLAICAFTLKDDKGTVETTDDEDITSHITNLTVNDGTDTYTIGRSPGVGPLYVAMKPVTAALTFTATDEYGQHYTKTLSSKTFAANNIYPIGMKMVKSYKTYTTIPAGTLLNVGDQIDPPANIYINGDLQTMGPSLAPYTLVRANVDGSTVTEAANGTHYVFKDKDGAFYGKDVNLLASEASDGLYVSGYYEGMHSYTMLTHVNLANATADYTAHTYDYLYGTLNPSLNLFVASGATVWLGGMTHHADNYVNGIECLGSATINLVASKTNDLTCSTTALNGISINTGTLTIDGTGTLLAEGGFTGAGIGGKNNANIVIEGGTITAMGGTNAAGIGASNSTNIGDITISGGNVSATGGFGAAGIGSSLGTRCGNITFSGGTITATCGSDGALAAVGKGDASSTTGDIIIDYTPPMPTPTITLNNPNNASAIYVDLVTFMNVSDGKTVDFPGRSGMQYVTTEIGGFYSADDTYNYTFGCPDNARQFIFKSNNP